jgi:hypothetical protein
MGVIEPQSVFIAVRLPQSVAAQLKEIANREHNGVAAVARRLLSAGLERETSNNLAQKRAKS